MSIEKEEFKELLNELMQEYKDDVYRLGYEWCRIEPNFTNFMYWLNDEIWYIE